MPDLIFKDLDRANYSANRLLSVLGQLQNYASRQVADLDQARFRLDAIAKICRGEIGHAIETQHGGMMGSVPHENFENDIPPYVDPDPRRHYDDETNRRFDEMIERSKAQVAEIKRKTDDAL